METDLIRPIIQKYISLVVVITNSYVEYAHLVSASANDVIPNL